jgi:large subunit ribosomal protein L29
MKAEELRELDAEELGGRLKGARRELYELRFKIAVGQLDNHREIRKARKEIARILTVVHQRRLEAVEGAPYAPMADEDRPGPQAEDRSEGREPQPEGEGGPAAAAADTEGIETPESAPSAASSETRQGSTEDAAEDPDAEAVRARRRRGRKTADEDEG